VVTGLRGWDGARCMYTFNNSTSASAISLFPIFCTSITVDANADKQFLLALMGFPLENITPYTVQS